MRALCIDIKCPGCGHTTRVKVRELVPGRSRRCRSCAATFQSSGEDGRRVQRALNDLERELKQVSRKFTIKLWKPRDQFR